MAITKWLLHSRRRWRHECRLLVQPGHTWIISCVVVTFLVFMHEGGHFTPSCKHFQCMHNKKTKILFLIRGSQGSFILDEEKLANHQSNQAPNKRGGGKATRRWKGPKSWQMKNPPRRVDDGKGGGRGTRWKGPKSWQMKKPPMGVDGWWGGEKGTRFKGPKSWQMRIPPKRADLQGNQEQIKYPNLPACLPSLVKSISDKERREEHHSSTSIEAAG